MKEIDRPTIGLLGFLIGIFLIVLLSHIKIHYINKEWKAKAIESKAAQYNPQTGEFEWIYELEKKRSK